MTRPGGEDLPFVFSGTLIVQGQGIARVRSTGIHTEMGNIGKALRTVKVEGTRLQKEVGRLVRRVAILGLTLCGIVVFLYGLDGGNWLQGFLAGITLAMAMLPEEFPVVLTVFLALSAWRLSKIKVLARRVPVIETLDSATVLRNAKRSALATRRGITFAPVQVSSTPLPWLGERSHAGRPDSDPRPGRCGGKGLLPRPRPASLNSGTGLPYYTSRGQE